MHATLTSFTGIGYAVARLNKGWVRYVALPVGYSFAIGAHFLHNLLASIGGLACVLGSLIDWLGFLGMFCLILYLVWREGRIMREQLREEVSLGLLTDAQYRAACSLTGQFGARLSALIGRRTPANIYDLCGELAFKKYQLARLGPAEEQNAISTIERLRGKLLTLNRKAE